jgi:two-component system OmpR family sensor kinase
VIAEIRRALPIRWKLAITCAALTFAILALFATVIGLFAGRQVRAGFDDDLRVAANDLRERTKIGVDAYGRLAIGGITRGQIAAAAAGDAHIRIVDRTGAAVPRDPNLGPPGQGIYDYGPYRVVAVPLTHDSVRGPVAYLQYAKPRTNPAHTVKEIRLFLTGGVVGGTLLALLAGLAIARRAMRPIANLTTVAKEIARTRNPAVTELPKPDADDEVADLARTLEEMLMALDASRSETEAALTRQREFVADASHELRTPLTSVLSNLELLESTLHGEDAEIAGSALRSSRRMRRLVADLLLLARADTGRGTTTRVSVDMREVVRDAAGEALPLAGGHELSVSLPNGDTPAPLVYGVPDDLHRLVLNLIENALAHTPPGSSVEVAVRVDGGDAVVEVADDGPGIPAELRPRIFERFVRGAGDSGSHRRGGSGLGLAIVQAVTQSHFGSVELSGEGDHAGTRFVVRLPLVPSSVPEGDVDTVERVRPPIPGRS